MGFFTNPGRCSPPMAAEKARFGRRVAAKIAPGHNRLPSFTRRPGHTANSAPTCKTPAGQNEGAAFAGAPPHCLWDPISPVPTRTAFRSTSLDKPVMVPSLHALVENQADRGISVVVDLCDRH